MGNSHSPPALAPRKAPQQRRAQASVEALVEAAARILAVQGLAGFTTNAVAARAGVSIGSLYQYFPNKDALMAALIAREQTARVARLAAAVDGAAGLPLAQGLAQLIGGAVAQDGQQGELARILDLEERRLPLDAEIEAARGGLDAEIDRFLGPHLPELGPRRRRQAARSLRLISQALIDGWADDPALAEAETLSAALSYLAATGTISGDPLRAQSESP